MHDPYDPHGERLRYNEGLAVMRAIAAAQKDAGMEPWQIPDDLPPAPALDVNSLADALAERLQGKTRDEESEK